MRFIKSASTTVFFKIMAMACGLGLSVIISRTLGPEGRGVYGIIMTVIILASSFGVFGINTANTYLVARKKSRARAVGVQSLVIGLVGSVLTGAIFLSVARFQPEAVHGVEGALVWLVVALLPLFLWGSLFSQAFLGLDRIVAYNLFTFGQRIIFVTAAAVVLALFGLDLTAFMTVVVVAVAILIAGYIGCYFKQAPSGTTRLSKLIGRSFHYGSRPYVATVFTLATLRGGIFFVNYFRGTDEAGLFAVAQQLAELLIIIPSVVGGILFPRIAGGAPSGLTARVIRTVALIFLPVFLLIALFARPIITLLFGAEFLPSAEPLMIFLPGAYLLGLQVIMAGDVAGRGYPWPAALVWIPVLALSVIGYYLLIPNWGINGAALSLSIAFGAIFLFMTCYLRKLTGYTLSEMFIPRREDIRTILALPKAILSRGSSDGSAAPPPSEKETPSAPTNLPPLD